MTTLAHRERLKEMAAAAEGFDKEVLEAAYATASFWDEIGPVVAAVIRNQGPLGVSEARVGAYPEDAARIALLRRPTGYVRLFLVSPGDLQAFGPMLFTWGGKRLAR